MGKSKTRAIRQETARAKRVRLSPASARVRHEVSPGLWLFEGDDGQLYLAVRQMPWQPWDHASYSGKS